MRFWYVVSSLVFFSIGFFFPIYQVVGMEVFQFKTDDGEWNYFYLVYAFYLIFCLVLNIYVAKIKPNEGWFLFVNVFIMSIYMFYMVWEAGKETFIVAITFSYILVIVVQIGLIIVRSLIRMSQEEAQEYLNENELTEEENKKENEEEKKE